MRRVSYLYKYSGLKICVCLMSIFALTIQAQDSKAPAAAVLKVKGKVMLLSSPKDQEGSAAKIGAMVFPGVSIKTGEDGLAMIKMLEDNSIIRIAPRSQLVVRPSKSGDASGKKARVENGSVLFNITRKMTGSKFDVETPTSVATVKGTRFWIIVGPDGSAKVITLEGLLSLLNINSNTAKDVGEGQTGMTSGNTLTVNSTNLKDIPSDFQENNLRLKFQDDKGETRELNIDFEENK